MIVNNIRSYSVFSDHNRHFLKHLITLELEKKHTFILVSIYFLYILASIILYSNLKNF